MTTTQMLRPLLACLGWYSSGCLVSVYAATESLKLRVRGCKGNVITLHCTDSLPSISEGASQRGALHNFIHACSYLISYKRDVSEWVSPVCVSV